MDKTTFTIMRCILSHMAPQQTTATSHNQEKDIYCLVGGGEDARGLQCCSVMVKGQKAKRKRVKKNRKRGRKTQGNGGEKKIPKRDQGISSSYQKSPPRSNR